MTEIEKRGLSALAPLAGVSPPPSGLPPGGGKMGSEAGSEPRGHLWVTWGVYLWAGKPPLADIILSHPPDLT